MTDAMKKVGLLAFAAIVALGLGLVALTGCSSSSSDESEDTEATETTEMTGTISVISREDGSGTRSAFVELIGVEDEDGNDATTDSAVITNSTAVMMTTVAGDTQAIGYISLGSLSDDVKALEVDGVAATTDGVKDGSYAVSRPFNVVIGDDLSDVAQDFLDFILSAEGQAVVDEEGYVAIDDAADSYTASGLSGTVVVAGSSSVTPVMEALAEAYEELNPDVTIEVQQSDSSTGVQNTIDGVCDLGMASRELKDSETAEGVTSTTIAMDGIAIIVNNDNPIDGLTSEQIASIFLGETTEWDDLA